MKSNKNHLALSALVLVTVISVANGGSLTYLDVLKSLTGVRGDIRTSLRAIRELAVQSGLITSSRNETSTPAPALSDQQPLELRMDSEESSENSDEESVEEDGEEEAAANLEGRKKGGDNNNNNIVVAGGGGGLGGHEAYYEVFEEDSGGKKGKKKGKKNRKKRRKHKGWKKHMKKAVPVGLGILALKAILLHFILKKLVLATALSLLLSKKSLLVSSLIALKLMFSQQHNHEKTESSKLEVVHIPIRKETGFHKKIQLNKVLGKSKAKIQPKQIQSTQKPQHTFNHYGSGSLIKHTHQQMEDFGGKYIPLGYESTQFNYDLTTPTTYLDSLPEGSEDNFFDVNDLQYIRREGWDGWTGWNRGGESADTNGYAGYEPRTSTDYSVSSSYDQPYSYNSHGNGAQFRENTYNNNNGQGGTKINYKQRNLSLMKYRRKRSVEADA